MRTQTLAKRVDEYKELANSARITLPVGSPKWKTHKEADEAFESLSAVINANNGKNESTKEKNTMSLKEMQKAYNKKLADKEIAKHFSKKKFKTKKDAMVALDDIEIFEETGEVPGGSVNDDEDDDDDDAEETASDDGDDSGEVEKVDESAIRSMKKAELLEFIEKENLDVSPKGKKVSELKDAVVECFGDDVPDDEEDEEEEQVEKPKRPTPSKVNRVQWVILNLFGKKTKMKMSALKDAYMEKEEKDNATIVPAQVGMMVKMGLVEKDGEKDKATVIITPEGKKAAKLDEPVPTPAPAKKPKFEPPYSEEEIASAKKKKAKKMKAENEAALEKYKEEHGRTQSPSSNPSQYNGTIPEGKWQKSAKKKNSASKAVLDLWEQEVTKDLLVDKKTFSEMCTEHGINAGTVSSTWNWIMGHYDLKAEYEEKYISGSGKKSKAKSNKPAKEEKGGKEEKSEKQSKKKDKKKKDKKKKGKK